MATDPFLLDRIRNVLSEKQVSWNEKKMFGGHCFMVDEKMAFGTYKGGLMVRVGPDAIEELSEKSGAEQMVHGGRPMTGYMMVEAFGYDKDEDLDFWVQKCLDFNPFAKASKKKKKKS